jgi:hypothetical protein
VPESLHRRRWLNIPHLRGETLVVIGAPMTIAAVVLVVGVILLRPPTEVIPARWLSGFGCYDTPVAPVGRSGVSGAAVLCISNTGVYPSIRAKGLTPGSTYSVWYLYLDRPPTCPPEGCVTGDLFGLDTAGSVGWLATQPAGPDGEASFVGLFRDLSPPHGSQLTLLIVGHGTADTAPAPGRPSQQATALTPEAATVTPGLAITDDPSPVIARAIFRLP